MFRKASTHVDNNRIPSGAKKEKPKQRVESNQIETTKQTDNLHPTRTNIFLSAPSTAAAGKPGQPHHESHRTQQQLPSFRAQRIYVPSLLNTVVREPTHIHQAISQADAEVGALVDQSPPVENLERAEPRAGWKRSSLRQDGGHDVQRRVDLFRRYAQGRRQPNDVACCFRFRFGR